MRPFKEGDLVRIDIPDEVDPDHNRYHDKHGEVVQVLEDDAGKTTGDDRDSVLYRIRFDNGDVADFRWQDLRPIRS